MGWKDEILLAGIKNQELDANRILNNLPEPSLGDQLTYGAKKLVKDKLGRVLLGPLNNIIDENITDVASTIGLFAIRSIRGRFTRSITFTIGMSYTDRWMEEALYGILYRYNNIKKKSNLELSNANGHSDGSGLYYRLGAGTHSLKYRDWNIMLVIQHVAPQSPAGRIVPQRIYTVITYNLDPAFIVHFERDMVAHRNSLLKIRADSPTINIWQDLHESDGYTYWEKGTSINKRYLNTVYLPRETKITIINTINNFLTSKALYKRFGVAWNLKILLYGPPGVGKDTIAKMIASEWNRNIYYVKGGKEGYFVPDAITSDDDDVNYPLFLVSDIDKHAFLINDTNVDLEADEKAKAEKMKNAKAFGNMLNALDGVMSGEGRIIVMTTNHIEKFSPTFTRDGRVDLMLHIGHVTPDTFRKYVYDNFDGHILPKTIKLKNDKLTMAQLQGDILHLKLTLNEFLKKHVQ